MFCYKCGEPCQDGQHFCSRCGANIRMGFPGAQPNVQTKSSNQMPQSQPPQPAVFPHQLPNNTVYIYRDPPVSNHGHMKVPVIIMLVLSILGLILYFSISLNSGRALKEHNTENRWNCNYASAGSEFHSPW